MKVLWLADQFELAKREERMKISARRFRRNSRSDGEHCELSGFFSMGVDYRVAVYCLVRASLSA